MKMKDERIEKGSNALAAKLLPLMLVLQAIVLGVKLALGGWRFCLLDVIALAAGLGTAAVLLTAKGVWRADDDALREIRNACLSRAFGTMLISLPEELSERRRVLDYLNGFEGVTAEEVR